MHRSNSGNDETGWRAAYERARDLHDGPKWAVRVSASTATVPQDKPELTQADFARGMATMMSMISDSHPR